MNTKAVQGRYLYIQTNDIREAQNAVLGYTGIGRLAFAFSSRGSKEFRQPVSARPRPLIVKERHFGSPAPHAGPPANGMPALNQRGAHWPPS